MNKKELLFELARTAVIEESGDGGAIIVSKQYVELAKDFLEYEKKLDKPYFTSRMESGNGISIIFYPEDSPQEAVIFSCDVGIREKDMYELIILARDIFY